jgi:serine/threonine-protein kinase
MVGISDNFDPGGARDLSRRRASPHPLETLSMAVATFVPASDLLGMLRSYKLLMNAQQRACDDFVRDHPDASPDDLIQFALSENFLTRFQADLVLSGNAHTLILPPFVLLDNAGRNDSGQVYRARGQNDDSLYLVKILARGTRAGTSRVTQTLRRFATFRDASIVPITHIGTVSERTYLVWPEPTEGQSLEDLIREQGKLPPKQVVHYALRAARALHTAHQRGLFHGLLKAADIWIDPVHRVLIKDLGMGFLLTLSREDAALDTMTSLGQLASGLDWASPESLLDQRDRTALSDQYSLGCLLYHALTGQVPFPVTSKVRKMMAHQTEEPTPVRELVPEVPARLAALVERLMKKVPAERYPDMGAVEAALRALLAKPESKPDSTPLPADPAKTLSKAVPAAALAKTVRTAAKPVVRPQKETPPAGDADTKREDTRSPWVSWAVPVLAGVAACVVGWLFLAS